MPLPSRKMFAQNFTTIKKTVADFLVFYATHFKQYYEIDKKNIGY